MDIIKRGRIELIVLFSTALFLSLTIIIRYISVIGHDRIGGQAFRTIGTIFLMILTFEGFRWPKWALSFFYIWAALKAFQFLSTTEGEMYALYSAMGTFYLFLAFYIHLSKSVTAYLASKNRDVDSTSD